MNTNKPLRLDDMIIDLYDKDDYRLDITVGNSFKALNKEEALGLYYYLKSSLTPSVLSGGELK